MGVPNKAKDQQAATPESRKGRRASKRMDGHKRKASASFETMAPYTVFSREPVIMKLSPEDSKIVREALSNPGNVTKTFAKAAKLHDRLVRGK